jgi:hypothetical protein
VIALRGSRRVITPRGARLGLPNPWAGSSRQFFRAASTQAPSHARDAEIMQIVRAQELELFLPMEFVHADWPLWVRYEGVGLSVCGCG